MQCSAAVWIGLLGLFLVAAPSARAGRLVLRIKAGNPINTPQVVKINSALPAGVGTNDVLDLAGLELGYNVKTDTYFVSKEVELGPREVVTYDVEINDIWNIPLEEIDGMRTHAKGLVEKLAEQPSQETAKGYAENIAKLMDRIVEQQDANSIGGGAAPIQHIRAYEDNLAHMKRARKDMFLLENLVLEAGLSFDGPVMGEDDKAPDPQRDVDLPEDQYKPAIIRVTVRNTSPDVARTVDLRRDLPAEIKSTDILDAGGLDVGVDSRKGACYVYKDGLLLQPLEERTFDVRIRDKWNVSAPRIAKLTVDATNLLARVQERKTFTSIEETLSGLARELEAIAKEPGPATLDEAYVSFHRRQADRVDLVERKLQRIAAVLKPVTSNPRWGFAVKPPSMKTTWMIIYIILGFLAIISLLFFLRWYGKTKAERM